MGHDTASAGDALPLGDGPLPDRTILPPEPDPTFDRFAQVVRTVIGVPVGLVSLVDQERQVFPGAAGLSSPWDAIRQTPLTHSFCQHVVRTNSPLVVSDARTHPGLADNLAIRDLSVVAYAGVPLIDLDGRPVGSLCAIDSVPRAWTVQQLALLDDLAAACSTELQLRQSVKRTEAAFRRTTSLLELSESLSAGISVTDVAETIARSARDLFGARFGGIAELLDHDVVRYVEHAELPGTVSLVLDDARLDGDRLSTRVMRTGRPMFVTVDELAELSPSSAEIARDAGGASFAYLPLISRGKTLGALTLMWTEPRDLDGDDRALLAGMARYAGQAIDRAQLLSRQREVARTLQAALLPDLPDLPWLELAGRYLPAAQGSDVGGDWYDAHPIGTDAVVVTVGDVSGHDTAAAAAMGQLRAAARAITVELPESTAVLLNRLEHVMTSLAFERIVTALTGTIRRDGTGAQLRWSNAGHPPPILITPGSPARFLDPPSDTLLGLEHDQPRTEHAAELPAGSTLLLFTDGLVERRDEDIEVGLRRLLEAVESARDAGLATLIDRAIGTSPNIEQFDDTAVLAVRVPGVG